MGYSTLLCDRGILVADVSFVLLASSSLSSGVVLIVMYNYLVKLNSIDLGMCHH